MCIVFLDCFVCSLGVGFLCIVFWQPESAEQELSLWKASIVHDGAWLPKLMGDRYVLGFAQKLWSVENLVIFLLPFAISETPERFSSLAI